MPDAQKVGKKDRLAWIARIAVATAAILWVFRGQDWRELVAVFRSLNLWWFAFSLGVFTVAQVVVALRWWLLLRAQSTRIPVLAAIRLFFLGLFYNNVMPGAVGGDLLKAWYVTKHTDRKIAGVLSVFVDRLIGLIALVLMAVATYSMFVRGGIVRDAGQENAVSGGGLSQYRDAVLWMSAAVAVILVLLLVHPYTRARSRRTAAGLWCKGLALLREMKDAVVVYWSRPWTLALVFAFTLFSQSTVIVAFWLLGRNLGIEADLSCYFVVFPVMWVISAVPVSIAGLGVFEAGMVEMFGLLAGVPAEQAMVLALCQRFVWVLASLPGGLIHLIGAHLPREEISIDCEETAN